ncbi:MAG: DMT family transporter [Clostridia bacterium]|nr:DMT family transporter [Clostridia bacterium]
MKPALRSPALWGTAAALIGNGIFGFSFMFSRIALSVSTPFVMLAWRFLIAFALIHVLSMVSAKRKISGWLRFRMSVRDCINLIPFGLIQPVAYFLCESYGISLTNATVSGIIIALCPIIALALGFVFMREKPSVKQILFSILSISGVIVMTLQQNSDGDIRFLGVVLLVGAVSFGASYNILTRKLSGRYSALERTYVMMMVAAFSFAMLAIFENRNGLSEIFAPVASGKFVFAIVYLSLFSSILAFLMINYASTVLTVSKTTAFCNLTTVLSVFAGVVFLGETITPVSFIAAAVIILGVVGVQRT